MADAAFIGREEPTWRKDKALHRKGFKDLVYLPAGRTAWNATLAAYAYAARRAVDGKADLPVWAQMHSVRASSRYEDLGPRALTCWHGTSAERAAKISEHGLYPKKGVWAALNPTIAHGYTRNRAARFNAGSAMIVFVIDKYEWEGRATVENDEIVRFHEPIPADRIEYILWADRIEFRGAHKAAKPKPWGVARFRRDRGHWGPRSRPPIRFDASHQYSTFDEWLDLSVRRIVRVHGATTAAETFSSLYATVDPWDALSHDQVFQALERLCGEPRQGRRGFRLFRLRA